MATKKRKLFNLYNPIDDVIRCPKGRAAVRKELDRYIRALLNLNGIIAKELVVQVFNEQNEMKTNNDEIYTLLLPLIFKKEEYYFYKEYVVSENINIDEDINVEIIENILEEKADKPYYLPEKEVLLKYENEGVIDNDFLNELLKFLFNNFPSKYGMNIFLDIAYGIIYDYGIKHAFGVLEKFELVFDNETQAQKFTDLYQNANNNTRKWNNNGYTPLELMVITSNQIGNKVSRSAIQNKIARNKPCPCGSGKKYKHCCALKEEIEKQVSSEKARLSREDSILFYETWYGLMHFINAKKNITSSKIWTKHPKINNNNDMKIHKVRDALWEEPDLIDEYVDIANISKDQKAILLLWKMAHRKGPFILYKFEEEYAIFIVNDEKGEDRLFGVKGMNNSIKSNLNYELPVFINTVLLPFKNKIVYDCYIGVTPISFGEGAIENLDKIYKKALKKGIVTR